jgi:hypothetical protein
MYVYVYVFTWKAFCQDGMGLDWWRWLAFDCVVRWLAS